MLLAWLPLVALFTAVLSGVFGMAGGMLLMGAYTAVLPVASAMVLHGGTQLVANGSRAWLLMGSVHWRGLAYYVLGAACAFAALYCVRFVPSPHLVYFALGASPLLAACLPARWFDFQRRRGAMLCGAQVAALQILAGAAGPLLDLAFVRTRLSRTQVVATKALTQVFAHALKIVYFAHAVSDATPPLWLLLALLVATLLGTHAGTLVLRRLSDEGFRHYSRVLVYLICGMYLVKAGFAYWGGVE